MKAIITGGAGFIGCNIAARLIREGNRVVVYDNLSRKGADKNLDWLSTLGELDFVRGDVRDVDLLGATVDANADADLIVHLAAQVAVTTSVADPRTDFEINLGGAFNLLEAVRLLPGNKKPFVIFASTNKVYGNMEDLAVIDRGDRYAYRDVPGADEGRPLDFHSPYGCSKGGADQYVLDYARIYGLPTCVFRMSCIYGPRQFGVEDQGWVAWFIIASVLDRPITIYGDGKQVRDVLYIEDLVDLYLSAFRNPSKSRGRVYNAGGGPENTLSLLELLAHLEKRLGKSIPRTFDAWRPGDQRVYISDTTRARTELAWTLKYDRERGVDALIDWVVEHRSLFE